MKCYLQILLVALLIAGCSNTEQAAAQNQQEADEQITTNTVVLLEYQDQITVDFLRSHLTVFAADSMKGRETGTPALKKAARYLARQYKKMGLQPAGVNNTYLQPFKLAANVADSIVYTVFKKTEAGLNKIAKSVSSKSSTAGFVCAFWGTDTLKAPVVFAGFGVVDSANNVNNLSGINFEDNWVMFFQEIPHVVNGDTLINPALSGRGRLMSLIRQKGATKILVITNNKNFSQMAQGAMAQFGEKTQMRLPYLSEGDSKDSNRSYSFVSPEMAAKLLGLDGAKALDEFKQQLTENITEFEPYETGYVLKQLPYSRKVTFESQNVAALIEGADPELKDQIVVLSSHYDHVGIGRPDSTGDRIYNGADDDGSGTIGLVNIAHALSEAAEDGVRPRRSILILNVAGEEKGLLGSRYYSDHPLFPIEKTVADLNVDMIGRIDPKHQKMDVENYVYIIGGKLISSGLDSLLRVANTKTGELVLSERYNDLSDPNQFYRRSDHWNFGRLGVPFIFFFSGVHEDYHRPSDEVAKIEFETMMKRARTIYGTAILVANTDERPVVDNQAFIKKTQQ